MLDAECGIMHTNHSISDAECGIMHTNHGMSDAASGILDTNHSIIRSSLVTCSALVPLFQAY